MAQYPINALSSIYFKYALELSYAYMLSVPTIYVFISNHLVNLKHQLNANHCGLLASSTLVLVSEIAFFGIFCLVPKIGLRCGIQRETSPLVVGIPSLGSRFDFFLPNRLGQFLDHPAVKAVFGSVSYRDSIGLAPKDRFKDCECTH